MKTAIHAAHSAAVLITLLALGYCISHAQPPSLEGIRALASNTNGTVSMASDGYGQHMAVVSGSQVLHILIGSDGMEISGYTTTIANGSQPVITAYNGKLRVAMKTSTQQISLYQSSDGGASWTIVVGPQNAQSDVYDIDSYTDSYGTHIVWATGTIGNVEVYYMSYKDDGTGWTNPFIVTNLPAQEYGYRPKVTTSAIKAHIAFVYLPALFTLPRLYSRDLRLDNGQWDGAYVISVPIQEEWFSSLNVTTLNDSIYAFIAANVATGDNHMTQNLYFAQRHMNDIAWRNPFMITTTSFGIQDSPMRNRFVAANGSLYFLTNCNYYSESPFTCFYPNVTLWRYQPASGFSIEYLYQGTLFGNEITAGSSLLLSNWFGGVYAFWLGYPYTYNMRRKPLAITETIAERTLLTGNNWVSGQAANIAYNFTADALANSITNVLDNSWLSVNGTLNANANSQFKFGASGRLNVYGSLNTSGTSGQPVLFTNAAPGAPRWTGITIATLTRLNQLNYCTITNADKGIYASYSKLNLDHSSISNCRMGLDLYGMVSVKYYCNITNSIISNCDAGYPGLNIESSDKVTVTSSEFKLNGGWGARVYNYANPRFYFNLFNSNFFGVTVENNSNPRFGDYVVGDVGGNTFQGNTSTAIIAIGASPFLGLNTGGGVMGGFNCTTIGSLGCYVVAQDGYLTTSQVFAEENYWGDVPPNPAKFCTSGGSTIDWDFWHSSCQGDNFITQGGGGSPSMSSVADSLLKLAMARRGVRDYVGALAIYTNLIVQRPNAPEAITALLEFRNTSNDYAEYSGNDTLRQTMRQYLRSQMNGHPNSILRQLARRMNATEVMRQGDSQNALAEYRQMLATATTDAERRACVYELFNISTMALHDRNLAAQHLARLQRDWPNDAVTRIAELRFTSFPEHAGQSGAGNGSLGKDGDGGFTVPVGYSLEQNYPNPFNPSTTIRYSIPKDAHVSLVVYDVLGREVVTIESGQKVAGSYVVNLDASRLASGVYAYRLQADGFSMIRKMAVIK